MKIIISTIAIIGISIPTILSQGLQPDLQYWKAYDKAGINVFETTKDNDVVFEGLKVRLGTALGLQFQALEHSNKADVILNNNNVNINELVDIGPGFNLATANLNLDAQLADGIRLQMTVYLSSRHHPETWVKGGFLQVDKLSFLQSSLADKVMEHVTVKVGHMEINYGDAHFRRTDNGNGMHNPFVGNYIMDAFTTEIGGEVYFNHRGFLAMVGVTGGEIKGDVTKPNDRKPTILGKLGYDNQVQDNLRIRLTGSLYTTESSVNNTLYGGDRTGSRYYSVMDNTISSSFTSGRFNPGLRDRISAIVINPFIKWHGLELFGNFEQAEGRSATETSNRSWTQIGGDLVYRIGQDENYYLAARYCMVEGKLSGATDNVSIDRIQVGGGWFFTPNILLKLEYVNQRYNKFSSVSIFNGGQFNGMMVEGIIAF